MFRERGKGKSTGYTHRKWPSPEVDQGPGGVYTDYISDLAWSRLCVEPQLSENAT